MNEIRKKIRKAYKEKYGDVSENGLGIFSDGWDAGATSLHAEIKATRSRLKATLQDQAALAEGLPKLLAENERLKAAVEEQSRTLMSVSVAYARLREALKEMVDWMENAPFDYRNGVTRNGFDEGFFYGWKGHTEIVKQAKAALKAGDER